jgi:hypothetical protein
MSDSETMIGPSKPGGAHDFKVFPKHYAELLVILGTFLAGRVVSAPDAKPLVW